MQILFIVAILLFSVIIHEYAHGWMALKYGDDTALKMGRLTLNPIPHIDLFGTILVPAILVLTGTPFLIGWAKPVPVNPYKVKNPRVGLPMISAAGPVSNLLQMLLGFVLFFICQNIAFLAFSPYLFVYLHYYISINLALALFNLFPVAPLDGSTIISFFMPDEMADRYEAWLRRFRSLPLVIILLINFQTNNAIFRFWFGMWKPVFSWIFNLFSIPYPFQ